MKLTAVVEIPKGSKYKYESCGILIENIMFLQLDRVLNQPIPYNYGFLPYSSIQEDGDKLDVFILSNEKIPALTQCKVNIIGGFKCIDNGVRDDKLVGILDGEDLYPNIAAIRQYLETYKDGFKVLSQLSYEEAVNLIEGNPISGAV